MTNRKQDAGAKQDTGIVNIHGKQYQTVAYRIGNFRVANPTMTLETVIYSMDSEAVVMRAIIADGEGRTIATGHAEEYRNAGQINKTSALENCETSAIGRALAAFGMGGTEFASANEVETAIHQQQDGNGPIPFPKGHYDSVGTIKQAMKVAVTAFAKAETQDDLLKLRDAAVEKILPQVSNYEPLTEWWFGRDGDDLMLGVLGNYNRRLDELFAEESNDLPDLLKEMHRNTSTAALKAWVGEAAILERLDALADDQELKFTTEYTTLHEQLTEIQNQTAALNAG